MRPPERPGPGAALVLIGTLLVAAGCGGGDDGERPGTPADSAASDTAGVRSPGAASDPDVSLDTPAPAADPARPLRAFRVRVRNRGRDTVVIVADAGTGARTLDTVPPADSSEVRVESRARRLEIRARGPGGTTDSAGGRARSLYDLERPDADSVLEFEVPPADPDSAG